MTITGDYRSNGSDVYLDYMDKNNNNSWRVVFGNNETGLVKIYKGNSLHHEHSIKFDLDGFLFSIQNLYSSSVKTQVG